MHLSDEAVARAAEELFGIREFRPKQKDIIRSILNGNNTLAVLPTGAGKSVTYQLPAMLLDGLTLVVTPLISLMKDQVRGLNERGLVNCDYLSSGRPLTETSAVLDRLKELKMLYVTPERLESRAFFERLRSSGVKIAFVVIDEAHCISLWGNTFRPSYRRIGKFLAEFPGAVVAGFTGTASEELRRDILKNLGGKHWNVVAAKMERENLSVAVRYVGDKVRYLVDNIDGKENVVIYTGSKYECERLQYILHRRGLPSAVYHAGLSAGERDKNQKLFMGGGKTVMIATSAFGMGIDKKDIRAVYHYHVPFEAEEYYQEIGRAGRDGKEAEAVLLVEPDDMKEMDVNLARRYPDWSGVKRLVRGNSVLPSDETVKRELAGMFSLEKFADIGGLRREYLLKRKNILGKARFMQTLVSRSRCRNSSLMEYFGEITLTCGKCDHCRAAESGFHSGQWTDGEIRMIAALGGFNGKIPIENLRSIVTGLKEKERLKSGFGSLRGTDRKVFGGIVLRLKNFHVLEFDPGNTSAGLNPLFKKWLDGR